MLRPTDLSIIWKNTQPLQKRAMSSKRDLKTIFYELYRHLGDRNVMWGVAADVGDRAICALSVEFHVHRLFDSKDCIATCSMQAPTNTIFCLEYRSHGSLGACRSISAPITEDLTLDSFGHKHRSCYYLSHVCSALDYVNDWVTLYFYRSHLGASILHLTSSSYLSIIVTH